MPYHSIVILTGAGVSAESGLKTFRASDGLWENHKVEEVATPEGYLHNPELVQNFYNQRRKQLLDPEVTPNRSHYALADLEKKFKGNFLLVTQNIDDLHERAGNERLIHMHGELLRVRCVKTGKVFKTNKEILSEDNCACCKKPKQLRPHVVWFGEMPLEMERIYEALNQCDLFISIGTSGNVYPAAGFVQAAIASGAHTVELNLEPSATGSSFKEKKYGPATEIVPQYVSQILES